MSHQGYDHRKILKSGIYSMTMGDLEIATTAHTIEKLETKVKHLERTIAYLKKKFEKIEDTQSGGME